MVSSAFLGDKGKRQASVVPLKYTVKDVISHEHLKFTKNSLWRRKWQPTPIMFLPGESQGQGSLVGCRLWGCTESDMTEAT